MANNVEISILFDLYGEALTVKQRDYLNYYYNDDLSLSEVAEEIGISRQGVRELIKKAEEELRFYEEKLGLAGRFRNTQRLAEQLIQLLKDADAGEEVRRAAEKLAETVR